MKDTIATWPVLFGMMAVLLYIAPSGVFAQATFSADSEALDAQCTAAYDYTCAYPGADQNGVPCGQGKPVASSEVTGVCVLENKAQALQVISVGGQWGGTEAPDISSFTDGPANSVGPSVQTDTFTYPTESAGQVSFSPAAPDQVVDIAQPESSGFEADVPDVSQPPALETPSVDTGVPATPDSAPATPEGTGLQYSSGDSLQSVPSESDAVSEGTQVVAPESAPSQNVLQQLSSDVTADTIKLYDDVATYFGFSPVGGPIPSTGPTTIGIRG